MQEEVNNAYNELVTAFLKLRLIPDKSLLEDLINKAEGLESTNYTKATFDGLTKALNEAKAVFDNPNTTQKEVDNAKDVLAKAIGLESTNYTKATFDGLTKALNEAKAVFDNPNTTQKEVDNAKDVLAKAIANLQTVTVDNTVKVPIANTPVNNGDTTVSVKTGDESLVGMLADIALLSVAGYALLRRKED